MKTLQEYLQESLLQHIAIELKDTDIIYEKYGEYDGCGELSEFIYNKLKENNFNTIKINYNNVKHIDNIFFDELYVVFEESDNINLNYIIPENDSNTVSFLKSNNLPLKIDNYSIINKETNRFYQCLIYIQYPKIRNKSLISKLNHELNHMFIDYKLQLQGFKSFWELFNNTSYKRTKEYNQHKHPFRARQIQNALYLFNEYEKNAFISQLCHKIRELKKSDIYYKNNKLDANLMYNIIKKLDIYQAYMNIGNFINDYDNDALTKNEKKDIIDEWKNIYNEDLTLNQIFKKLKQKFTKTKQKIESIIPKKIVEEYTNIIEPDPSVILI